MSLFESEPTRIAEWQALVAEAQAQTGYAFEDSLENYLVLTLDRFMTENGIVTSVMALDFLEGVGEDSGKPNGILLRDVGDQCLLISGLFPERALRKNVPLDYFVGIGQQAYFALTDIRLYEFDNELFYKLGNNFIGLMDVLNAMRSK